MPRYRAIAGLSTKSRDRDGVLIRMKELVANGR